MDSGMTDNPAMAMQTAQNWMIGTFGYTVVEIDMRMWAMGLTMTLFQMCT